MEEKKWSKEKEELFNRWTKYHTKENRGIVGFQQSMEDVLDFILEELDKARAEVFRKFNKKTFNLNTQPQAEDWRNITVGQLMEDRKKVREFLQNNPDFLKECEPKVKTATGVAMDFKPQDTPEQKEEWEERTKKEFFNKFNWDYFFSKGTKEIVWDYVKNLLSEREREVLNSMREWVVEYHKDNWDIRDFDAEIAIGKIIDRELDKLKGEK